MSFRCLFYDGKGNAFFWKHQTFLSFSSSEYRKSFIFLYDILFFVYMSNYIYNKVETAAQKKMSHGADYVFMADMWNPKHLSDSRHLWVPISWENGAPVLKKQ